MVGKGGAYSLQKDMYPALSLSPSFSNSAQYRTKAVYTNRVDRWPRGRNWFLSVRFHSEYICTSVQPINIYMSSIHSLNMYRLLSYNNLLYQPFLNLILSYYQHVDFALYRLFLVWTDPPKYVWKWCDQNMLTLSFYCLTKQPVIVDLRLYCFLTWISSPLSVQLI